MSASISVYLRNDRKLSGKRPLYLRIIIDRKVKNYSTGKSIEPVYWDQDKEQVKTNYANNTEFNTWITSLKLRAEKIILDIENNNLSLNIQNFHIRFSDKEGKGMFMTWVKEIISDRQYQISSEFSGQLLTIMNKLEEYRPGIRFSDLTSDFVREYEYYLFSKGNSQNTVSNNLKRIKYFCDLATEKGLMKKSPFAGVKLKWKKSQKQILSFADVRSLEMKLPEMPLKVQKALHAFLFALYHGGLRYSDLIRITPENLRSDGIYLIQNKTDNPVFIPFNPAGVHHLPEAYSPGQPIFQVISEQKFRDYLKLAAMYAEVNTDITTRTARHTFISLSSSLGMDFKMISQIAGHTSVKMTEKYHHPQAGALISEIKKWDLSIFNFNDRKPVKDH